MTVQLSTMVTEVHSAMHTNVFTKFAALLLYVGKTFILALHCTQNLISYASQVGIICSFLRYT